MPVPATIVNAPDPAAAVAALPDTSPRYTFTVPPRTPGILESDPKTFTLKPLTLSQEIDGNRMAAASGDLWQKVALSLDAVDGRKLAWETRDQELALQRMSPKCRDFVSEAYRKIHVSAPDETKAFLDSMKLGY